MFDFKNDKSWLVIMILIFAFAPVGIIALIIKMIYTINKSRNESGDTINRSGETYSRKTSNGTANDVESRLHGIEVGLKDTFETWKETDTMDQTSYQFDHYKEDSYDSQGFPVELTEEEDNNFDVSVDEAKEAVTEKPYKFESEVKAVSKDYLATDHLEAALNDMTDITFNDVHIDTEITFDDEPEDHDHEGEVPLKVVACTMCGTENSIYIIDRFETPTCEKCGMLLLDRH